MTADTVKTCRPFLEVLLEHAGNPGLPPGYDTWGFKIVRPDLRSYNGYRWPWPGGTVDDPATITDGNPCPGATPGVTTGGYCVALTLRGAASGGHGHETILLLAYRAADIAGEDRNKRRVSHALVADVIDGRAVYHHAAGANLAGADLRGANLRGANLTGADLANANLANANLTFAYLAGAYLGGADLGGADLRGAYLGGADLRFADLGGADLGGANLTNANLRDADLANANLRDAYLRDAQVSDRQREQFTGEPSWLS